MKTLFVVPEIRLDSAPFHFPFWTGILAAIVEEKKGQVAVLDLNAMRARYNGKQVPNKIIQEEIASDLNSDGIINIQDVILIINIILNN